MLRKAKNPKEFNGTTGCPIDFCTQKNGDQIAYMSSKSKISKILKGFEQLGLGIFEIFEKYGKMKIF